MLKQKNYFIKRWPRPSFYFIASSINVKKRSFKESVLSLTFSPYSANFEPPSFTRSTTFKTESNSSSDKSSTIDNNFGFHQIYRLQTFNFITIGNMRYLLNNFSEAMTATETLATAAMLKPIPIFVDAFISFSSSVIFYFNHNILLLLCVIERPLLALSLVGYCHQIK